MPSNPFELSADSVSSPARNCVAIVPNDANDLAVVTKALYVGTGGNIVVRTVDATADVTFANVPTGTVLPVRARAIRATGTTASQIVGLA
ncbi:hypothetical protein OKA06_01565 [Novosphingobium sp. MW5]|nr:hypothetical protein [Novosphingobium sp. MW5]